MIPHEALQNQVLYLGRVVAAGDTEIAGNLHPASKLGLEGSEARRASNGGLFGATDCTVDLW